MHTVTVQIGSVGCKYWLKDIEPLANTSEDTEGMIARLLQFVPEVTRLVVWPERESAASIF